MKSSLTTRTTFSAPSIKGRIYPGGSPCAIVLVEARPLTIAMNESKFRNSYCTPLPVILNNHSTYFNFLSNALLTFIIKDIIILILTISSGTVFNTRAC